MIWLYEAMLRKGLTTSLRHFSKVWLGKSPNYVADRGWDAISMGAMAVCALRLRSFDEEDLAEAVIRYMGERGPSTGSIASTTSTPRAAAHP